ncbi:MAG: shikimate dehydrogenase [Desulfarculales bacterium]|jgi:shikimate dehydrogenase|nr:shikimate dehydrogenase [Desulfarculales bacterium]
MDKLLLGIISDERAWLSKSPLMHRAALRAAGLKGYYVPLALEEANLTLAVDGLWALGFKGANVTAPYKQIIIPCLESLSRQAKEVGAVNTLVRGERGFVGHNSDVSGFCSAAGALINEGESIALVGAGGVARAVLAALKNRQIYLLGRNAARTNNLAAVFGQQIIPHSPLPDAFTCGWLINATSVSSPEESREMAAWVQSLRPLQGVIDLNYGRKNNFWRDLAERCHVPFQDGLSMLAFQAKDSFKLWTGLEIEIEVFQRALL